MASDETKEAKSSSQKPDSTEDKPSETPKVSSSPTKTGSTADQSKSPQKNNNNNSSTNAHSSQSKASTPSSTKSGKSSASIEKYNELKKKLTQQILKKQEITNKLSKLEDTIYQKESDYFEESYSGNIVKGFENFSKSSGGGSGGSGGGSGTSGFRRKMVYTEDDHIFSLSSINFVKNMVKRHGPGYANGSIGNGTASSIINSKDDFDDYEDSVDPTTANMGIKSNNTAAAAASENKSETSRSSTPSRKRKARTIED
ncbi:EAF6 [Candida margitis]|uniref:EAF6 n=1 Tax=Candida margitis TaxID=1775924 RepID=UPI002227DA0D|nr:EAF6 [Candida margitis]KAI5950399.1 EAF6 [Candida margitis]